MASVYGLGSWSMWRRFGPLRSPRAVILRPAQRRRDRAAQLCHAIGLLDEAGGPAPEHVGDVLLGRVARPDEDLEARRELAQRRERGLTREPRHAQVEEH